MEKINLLQNCEEATRQLLNITESLKGWNLISGLYNEPSEQKISELCVEARVELHRTAQMLLLGTFFYLEGRQAEYALTQAAIQSSKRRVDGFSTRCTELIKESTDAIEAKEDAIKELLRPVLEYMVENNITTLNIKQNGKEEA